MAIQSYFAQVKTIVDQYTMTNFVLDAKVSFEIRSGNQGYLTGSIIFVDNSALYFSEFLDAVDKTVDKLMYSYHYQDVSNQLIFRYDNARHKPPLPSLEHKHIPGQIVVAAAPTLDNVLTEVTITKEWV